MSKSLPPPKTLRKLLRYEPKTGLLFWCWRDVEMFSDGIHTAGRSAAQWNAKHARMRAFTADNCGGYKHGKIFGRGHLAHRVIWAMQTGKWPDDQIDHINGIRHDNRLVNLRVVSNAENCRNQRLRCDNNSGAAGVNWNEPTGKWRARIHVAGKSIHLGLFIRRVDAITARASAEIVYGFHENHGSALGAAP